MKTITLALVLVVAFADAAFSGISVLGGLTLESTLDPGETREGTIQLFNNGDREEHVVIYQTDYLFYADGRTLYDDPGSTSRSNAGWISFSPSRTVIPAGATVSAYYRIRVPQNADLHGTYWSVLMIEPRGEAEPLKIEEQEGKVVLGVQTIIRYAVQMITNIGETGVSNIELLNNAIVAVDGKRVMRVEIANTGERWLRPAVSLELYDAVGQYVGRYKSDTKRIFPACSVNHQLDVTDVPDGRYTALLIVDNGDDRVFGANYEVRLGK